MSVKSSTNLIIIGPVKSRTYFYSKKYLKHFITELIEVELKVKAKLKVVIMIPPTLRPSAAWGSRGWTVTRGGLERFFELLAKAGSQGLAWAPCPGQPHSGPHSPELPAEDLPTLEAQDGPPPRAPGCCGPQSGRNHNWNFQFRLQFEINHNELHDEVLEIFFAGDTKENCKSLKPVSVHYRNKAWINNIEVLSF